MPAVNIPIEIINYINAIGGDIEKIKDNPEFWRLVSDFKKMPNEYCFEYKKYLCKIKRGNYGFHLCGYVEGDIPLLSIDKLNEIVYGGITAGNDFNIIGFDCAHYLDYSINIFITDNRQCIYKDTNFVEQTCKNIVDFILNMQRIN